MYTSTQCTYNPILLIIYILGNQKKWSYVHIKETIVRTYTNYEKYFDKIVHILKDQGKLTLMHNVKKIENLKQIILSDEYYLTELDIFALCNHLKLNVVLFSNSTFNTMNSNINWLLIDHKNNKDEILNKKYYFIRTPNYISANRPPSFSLINTPKKISDIINIDLDNFKEYENKNIVSFAYFIGKYKIK